ncbi:endonuclease domain-containing protein [Cognatiluteimonas telluris]|jgi:primosomal protein N' (replication factor Y)|uniref:endonuclease domain-containing protein n=1 Tax=Cognatiluteimonas telluris TaxID=1104775 RepID=UPI001409577C|nr:endonuclease domain-containing protein [Lysobacter telluris]
MRTGQKTGFARQLRRRQTDAERKLWHQLRNGALMGCKFRRQHPVGPYIVDFICVEASLVIELDGSQHQGCGADAARTSFLEREGYRVLRFWNNDALMQTDSVLAIVYDVLFATTGPHPNPSPARGSGA